MECRIAKSREVDGNPLQRDHDQLDTPTVNRDGFAKYRGIP